MKRPFIPILLLLFLISGCDDANIEKVARSMKILATTVGQVQTNAIEWNKAGLMNQEATDSTLSVCNKINAAGLQIDAILRELEKLDPTSANIIIDLLVPISAALDPDQIAFIAGIQDPARKEQMIAYFLAMRSTVSSVMIVLAAVS